MDGICGTNALAKKIVIEPSLTAAGELEGKLLELLSENGYSEGEIFAVKLAFEEALSNAIKHGSKCDPGKTVRATLDIDSTRVILSVTDQGDGFEPSKVPDPTLDENIEKPFGRGLMLMHAYMDEVTFDKNGRRVRMVKYKQ